MFKIFEHLEILKKEGKTTVKTLLILSGSLTAALILFTVIFVVI